MIRNCGLIWDFDGVINLGIKDLFKILNRIAKDLQIKQPGIRHLQQLWGMDWDELLRTLANNLGWSQEQFKAFKQRFYEVNPHEFNFMPREYNQIFNSLSQYYYMAIVTNRKKISLTKALKIIQFDPSLYFDYVQARDDYQYKKPHPKALGPILTLFKDYNPELKNLFYIGDTVDYDYFMVKDHNPKINFVGILSGANTIKMFTEAGLKRSQLLRDIAELPQYLDSFKPKK